MEGLKWWAKTFFPFESDYLQNYIRRLDGAFWYNFS